MRHFTKVCALAWLLFCIPSALAQDAAKKQLVQKEDPFIVTHIAFCKDERTAKELADDIVLALTHTQPKEPQELRSHLDALGRSRHCVFPANFDGAFFHWETHRDNTKVVQLPGYRAGIRSLSRLLREGPRTVHRYAAVVAVPLSFALRSERQRGARQMLEFFKQRGLGTFNGPRPSKPKLDI